MRTILVLPSCNEPGLEILRALRESPNLRVLAASGIDPDADPSRDVVDAWFALPMLGAPDFEPALDALLAAEEVDHVFVTTDDLVVWAARRRASDPRFIAPSVEAAETCASKRAMRARLASVVALPDPWSWGDPGKGFARPDRGGGGRGAFVVDSPAAAALAAERDLIVDAYLPGPEFTVDCVGDPDGRPLVCAPRQRLLMGRGIALASRPVDRADLVEAAHRVGDTLRIAGPYFVQFREDAAGRPRFLEVNARVGGSMGATRLRGINLPQLAVHLVAGDAVRVPAPIPGLVFRRSLTTVGTLDDFDQVIWDLDDTLVDRDGRAMPDAVRWLYLLAHRGAEQRLLTLNPAPQDRLTSARVPDFFAEVVSTADKASVLEAWFAAGVAEPRRTLMINDSNREKLALSARWPDLRILTPDALGAISPRARVEPRDAGDGRSRTLPRSHA